MATDNPLNRLKQADPQLAELLRVALSHRKAPVDAARVACLLEDALWGLVQDEGLGQLFARGLAELIESASLAQLEYYRTSVRKAAATGISLASLLAAHLWPVVASQKQALLEKFTAALTAMRTKGTYCLKPPLEAVSYLLRNGEADAAAAFLDLLACAFSKDLNYNRCLGLSNSLPKAARMFAREKRPWQIGELIRLAETDVDLIEPFIGAMQSGLETLGREALTHFVSMGLEKFNDHPGLGRRFFGLESRLGQEACRTLQVAADLGRMRPQLERYLKARTGLSIPVLPLAEVAGWLPEADRDRCQVCSDGRRMYLPDEMDIHGQKAENENHYKLLVRLEAGLFEFGTFDFDLEKALEQIPQASAEKLSADAAAALPATANPTELCDLMRFYGLFDLPALAEDLFNLFEFGRIRKCLARNYPGLARTGFGQLIEAVRDLNSGGHFLMPLFRAVALGEAIDSALQDASDEAPVLRRIIGCFDQALGPDATVEASAALTARCYRQIRALHHPRDSRRPEGYEALHVPFGRKIRANLWSRALGAADRLARRIQARLSDRGVKVFAADIRTVLLRQDGVLGADDLLRIIFKARSFQPAGAVPLSVDLASLNFEQILGELPKRQTGEFCAEDPAYRYKEWDCRLQDYLEQHVRVVEKTIDAAASDFYARTLQRRKAIAERMRRAFELLKPEGLEILRQWIEGDAFDYRALLDFAVDRKAGLMPSDRLYIKRLKRQRDVAVLLLVDLSRSTANRVVGTPASVLDVEKEAIVLFCEALTVVGDAFAVAGFSGSGRLNVGYWRIKDFGDGLGEPVKQRISAIAPQRSTRMGAAIRHATRYLMQASQKVRLMIILSDGFPNDLDYKADYAVEDTRKAVLEARAKSIFTKAITVNMGADSRLDDLYGAAHHYVITDVQDLPDRLLRVYGRLTRY
jgi:nitric oxide reductase NorD protein